MTRIPARLPGNESIGARSGTCSKAWAWSMSLTTGKKQSWLQIFPLHPFVFAVYPILALLAFNISEVDFSSGIRPLLSSIFVAGLLILIFYAIVHDWKRAALLSSILLILFYSYGHIYVLLKAVNVSGFYLFRHRTLIPLWIGLAVLLV